ncbi:fluoride efflux transporter FluC [Alicyclobacillus contaminans]|uniref:fluoride efflux transporter FluC n=1 Tax=Alicyclobacillus contaminans TaxID=392016 RepID=UPI000415863B|nr:CrcB family protein [Alicyclobacillus contaminans]
MIYIALVVGGIVGGLLRYAMETWLPAPWDFPWSTLCINLTGSFILGLFYQISQERLIPPWMRIGFAAGVIGSFTTFSTFCLETSDLFSVHLGLAALYALVSMIGGPLLAWLGDATPVLLRHWSRRQATEEPYS